MSLVNRARFGQTEVGSFVLTMECNIAPVLQHTLMADGDPGAPLERKAYVRLAHGLAAAEGAARQSAASGKIEPFRTRTGEGVSANLRDAIAEILEATSAEVLRAGFSFAPVRPLDVATPRQIAFSSDTAPILREAAARLRDEASYPSMEVVGTVVKLDSADAAQGGNAFLRADIDGRIRQIRVPLSALDYKLAIQAHRDRALVRCAGDLAREGRSWTLRNALGFAIAPEPEEP